jgi:hypothetical protein
MYCLTCLRDKNLLLLLICKRYNGRDFTLKNLFTSFNGGEKIAVCRPFEVLTRHLQVRTETLSIHSQRSMETDSDW